MNEQLLQELKIFIKRHTAFHKVSDQGHTAAMLPNRMHSIPNKECLLEKEEQIISHECYANKPISDLEDYINKVKNEETFSTKLLKYIDQTGLSDAEIYRKAGIDRRHFSKIRCDRNYRPKKSTAVAFCLALRLNAKHTEELLELAGYSLSSSDTGDLVVRFCIEKGIYDLMEVNEALDYFGVKCI